MNELLGPFKSNCAKTNTKEEAFIFMKTFVLKVIARFVILPFSFSSVEKLEILTKICIYPNDYNKVCLQKKNCA